MNMAKRFAKAERNKLWGRLEWLRESLIRDGLGNCSLGDLARRGNADALEICRILDRLTGKNSDARGIATPTLESFPNA